MNRSYTKTKEISSLLPSIEILEKSRSIVESTLSELGRLTLETILSMSAIEIAGEPQRGKKKGGVLHHGSQRGHVKLSGKRIEVEHPRHENRLQ